MSYQIQLYLEKKARLQKNRVQILTNDPARKQPEGCWQETCLRRWNRKSCASQVEETGEKRKRGRGRRIPRVKGSPIVRVMIGRGPNKSVRGIESQRRREKEKAREKERESLARKWTAQKSNNALEEN